MQENKLNTMRARFRGFYPVVLDLETAGFDSQRDAILEIAMVTLGMDHEGWMYTEGSMCFHTKPFPGSSIQPEAIAFNRIDPFDPLREAVSECNAFSEIFRKVRDEIRRYGCSRAIMVAHNAAFDHGFLMAAAGRSGLDSNPFHPFATFDTASLSGLVLGQTVLAKACMLAGIPFDGSEAHSALYDAERTALLFCELVNRWKRFGGWPA